MQVNEHREDKRENRPIKKQPGSAGCSGCGHVLLFRRLAVLHDFSNNRVNDRRPFDNGFDHFFQSSDSPFFFLNHSPDSPLFKHANAIRTCSPSPRNATDNRAPLRCCQCRSAGRLIFLPVCTHFQCKAAVP